MIDLRGIQNRSEERKEKWYKVTYTYFARTYSYTAPFEKFIRDDLMVCEYDEFEAKRKAQQKLKEIASRGYHDAYGFEIVRIEETR